MRGLTWWLCTHLAPFISWLSLPNGPQGKATCVALPGTLYVAGLVSILQIFYLLHLLRTFSHLTFSLQLSSASSASVVLFGSSNGFDLPIDGASRPR